MKFQKCVLLLFLHVLYSFEQDWVIREENGYCENSFDRESGTCMEIRKCEPIVKILKNGPLDSKTKEKLRSYVCGQSVNKEPKVCCPDSVDVNNHPNLKLLPNKICGISIENRITSGYRTAIFEFPWMALLAYKLPTGIQFLCGGTVITNRYVLTAAHCIRGLKPHMKLYGVRLGEHDIESEMDCVTDFGYQTCTEGVQDFKIDKIIVHPAYDRNKLINDIALIRLDSEANFSVDNVKPICLPIGGKSFPKDRVTISGWGFTENGTKSNVLLRGEVPIVPNKKCAEIYKKTVEITENHLCAGGFNGTDSCGGDSGGPLKYFDYVDNVLRYVQGGVVSFGPKKCGIDKRPGVYTRLSNYMTWILDNLSQ